MTTDLSFATKRGGLSRVGGGFAALIFPLSLTVLAVSQGFARNSLTGFATAFLAAILFLVAAPTAWILAFDFIDVSSFTTIILGLATSLPLWYVIGLALAGGAPDWREYSRRYVTVCVVWTALNLAMIALVAAV